MDDKKNFQFHQFLITEELSSSHSHGRSKSSNIRKSETEEGSSGKPNELIIPFTPTLESIMNYATQTTRMASICEPSIGEWLLSPQFG